MNKYDLVVVGTGFSSTFFLKRFLERFPDRKVAVVERGSMLTHKWRLENRDLDDYSGVVAKPYYKDLYINHNPSKPWVFTPAFGGGSNCWWGCTPRLLPNDFKIKTLYGVGMDWPIGYDDLEPYYCQAENIMAISGNSEDTPFARSQPYPQPPHRMHNADLLLKKAYPTQFFHMPTARPSRATENRPRCCANAVCNLCPIDSKFSVLNELMYVYKHPNVQLLTETQVIQVDIESGVAKGVLCIADGREVRLGADMVALGANPIFNSHILLRSNISNQNIGKGLIEQVGVGCRVKLNGLDSLNGSTALTGNGYMLYDGEHRSRHAACLIESMNLPSVRLERGRYSQTAEFKFVFDDLPQAENLVSLSADIHKPEIRFSHHTAYVDRAIANVKEKFETLFSVLPIESYEFSGVLPSEGHILGTAVMGDSPAHSVVDKHQRSHEVANLFVLGGSSFSAISPANPTLTIAALALYSADHV